LLITEIGDSSLDIDSGVRTVKGWYERTPTGTHSHEMANDGEYEIWMAKGHRGRT